MSPQSLAGIAPPLPTNLCPDAHLLVRALRIAAVHGFVPAEVQLRIAEVLRSGNAAREFRLLLAAVGQAWPDPVVVFRPCCPRLTHDEFTILAMMGHARSQDRPAFDQLLRDLIGADARDCLYLRCLALVGALPQP